MTTTSRLPKTFAPDKTFHEYEKRTPLCQRVSIVTRYSTEVGYLDSVGKVASLSTIEVFTVHCRVKGGDGVPSFIYSCPNTRSGHYDHWAMSRAFPFHILRRSKALPNRLHKIVVHFQKHTTVIGKRRLNSLLKSRN